MFLRKKMNACAIRSVIRSPISHHLSLSATMPRRRLSSSSGNPNADQKTNASSKSTKWYPIPLSIGLVCLAYIEYRHLQNRPRAPLNRDIQLSGPWYMHLYTMLPLRSMSRLWGTLNNLTVPEWARGFLYRGYAYAFGCALDEAQETDLTKFENLGQFFYRSLKPGVRPIDSSSDLVIFVDSQKVH